MITRVEHEYNEAVDKLKISSIKIVDKLTWQYRLNNCKKCKFYQTFTENQTMFKCKKCGCAGYKFMIESVKCPLTKPKWK
jgi:hypothetical protein